MEYVVALLAGIIAGGAVVALIKIEDPFNDEFSCANCKHINLPEGAEPCNRCRRDMKDYWEEREDA